MSFQDLLLDPRLMAALTASGFTAPTDIQRQAIPVALEGRDLMASAQTGTGKTAAFVLPTLHRLLNNAPRVMRAGPRVLVLTPTRELAVQVTDAVRRFGIGTGLRSGVVVGGEPYAPQERLLRGPVDVLVATPGRLMDHMRAGRVDLARVEVLVLDEADRMLDMGFRNDVETIAAGAPKDRQTLLFSATLQGAVLDVATSLLNNPVRIALATNRDTHAAIEQRVHQADDMRHKQALLHHLLTQPEMGQSIVFTATKRAADDLAFYLENLGHAAAPLHGDLNQKQRSRVLDALKRGRLGVLVATDVAARGLDVKELSHVINFDLPNAPEDYIHRIGRTGRGGASGVAVSLIGPMDWPKLAAIERVTGQKLERVLIPGLEPSHPEPRPGQHHRGGKFDSRRPSQPGQAKRKFGNSSSSSSSGKPAYGNR